MSQLLDAKRLDEALTLLGSALKSEGADPVEMIVCGGSSLIARGFVVRQTRDVDVLALRKHSKHLISARPMPEALIRAAATVASLMRLPPRWLNDGPADLFEMGLPEGFAMRLLPRSYGSHLTASFIGRLDQIHFKLYAAADQGPGQHVDDLIALKPDEAELVTAARWAFTHDVSPGFRFIVKDLLKEIGHANAAKLL